MAGWLILRRHHAVRFLPVSLRSQPGSRSASAFAVTLWQLLAFVIKRQAGRAAGGGSAALAVVANPISIVWTPGGQKFFLLIEAFPLKQKKFQLHPHASPRVGTQHRHAELGHAEHTLVSLFFCFFDL